MMKLQCKKERLRNLITDRFSCLCFTHQPYIFLEVLHLFPSHSIFPDITSAPIFLQLSSVQINECSFSSSPYPLIFTLLSRNPKSTNIITMPSPKEDKTLGDTIEQFSFSFLHFVSRTACGLSFGIIKCPLQCPHPLPPKQFFISSPEIFITSWGSETASGSLQRSDFIYLFIYLLPITQPKRKLEL